MVKALSRYLQEIIFGSVVIGVIGRVLANRRLCPPNSRAITTVRVNLPQSSTWYLMSHLPQPLDKQVGNLYGLRTWIEYGFKQCKNHLGWADFRVTHYGQIEPCGKSCLVSI